MGQSYIIYLHPEERESAVEETNVSHIHGSGINKIDLIGCARCDEYFLPLKTFGTRGAFHPSK